MGFISELFGYLLNFLYNILSNYGYAIIIFTVLLRVVLLPISINQQKSMKKSSKLQEEMREIQKKYKNDPEKLNQETIELYKREKFSPFSGCLTAILQLVIILSVFWLVSQPLTYMKKANNTDIYNEYTEEIEKYEEGKSYKEIAIINKAEQDYQAITYKIENYDEVVQEPEKYELYKNEIKESTEEIIENKEEKAEEIEENTEIIDKNEEKIEEKTEREIYTKEELQQKKEELENLRLNMNFLGVDLSKVVTQSMNDWKVYIIPILYIISTFISIKINTVTQNSSKNENKETSLEEESMEQMNKTMSYMMPIMSVWIAIIAPLGLALYWLVSNVLMIIERLTINKIMSIKEENENAK